MITGILTEASLGATFHASAPLPRKRESSTPKAARFFFSDLNERITEKRYSLSVAAVEAARMLSERKMLYLHEIVAPALPEDAEYPKRWLDVGMTFLASLIAWAITVGAMNFIRNHMA